MTQADLFAESFDRQIVDALRITDDLLTRLAAWLSSNGDTAPVEQLIAALNAVSEAQDRSVTAMQLLAGRPTSIEEHRRTVVCPACEASGHGAPDTDD